MKKIELDKPTKINTQKIHYVKVPENLIVIDFDLKDANKQKSLAFHLQKLGQSEQRFI